MITTRPTPQAMSTKPRHERIRLALSVFVLLLVGCDGGADGSHTGSITETAAGGSGASRAAGPEFYLSSVPSPCSLLTDDVAQDLLQVSEVAALPNNSGPGSLNPRCGYRDGQSLGKAVSIMVFSTPHETFSARMPADEVSALVNQYYAQDGAPYETAGLGPGAQRFVATTGDAATMFVMTGLGVSGGSFDPTRINAEAAFAVAVRDPARTAEQRLTEVRNLAVAYHSNLVNAALQLE